MSGEFRKIDGRPRAANWLWHRWYAKRYWAAFAVFWGTFVAVWLTPLETGFFRSTPGAYAMLFFNPIIVLLLLGAGYVRASILAVDWEWKDPAESDHPWPRSLRGTNDPYSDAADPRSPNWIGSPHIRARRYGDG